jgi:hypothetical protein
MKVIVMEPGNEVVSNTVLALVKQRAELATKFEEGFELMKSGKS